MSSPPPAQTQSPPHERKAPLVKTSWRRFCCVFVYLCILKLQKNCGLHSSQFDTRYRNVDLALSSLISENLSQIAKIPPWFKRKLGKFPPMVQQTFLCLCVRIVMQIKAAKKWRIALISVWQTKPKRWPCFISTDMRKLVSNRKNSALIQTQIRHLSGHRSTKFLYLYVRIFNFYTFVPAWSYKTRFRISVLIKQGQRFGIVCQTEMSATCNSFAALICINIRTQRYTNFYSTTGGKLSNLRLKQHGLTETY